jgi:hypothetical protein
MGDPAYTPCVLNGSGVPISYVATFTDGTSSPGSLPPGSASWQRVKGRQLRSLVVHAGTKRTYGASLLDQLRATRTVAGEVWVIRERGIALEDRRQIETIRSHVAETPK